MENVKLLIGKRIKQRREEIDLSQIELARAAGKESATYIALIESGERNVNPTDLIKIAEALSTTASSLIGQESVPKTDLKFALQNDGELKKEDKQALLRIIDTMKNAHHRKYDSPR